MVKEESKNADVYQEAVDKYCEMLGNIADMTKQLFENGQLYQGSPSPYTMPFGEFRRLWLDAVYARDNNKYFVTFEELVGLFTKNFDAVNGKTVPQIISMVYHDFGMERTVAEEMVKLAVVWLGVPCVWTYNYNHVEPSFKAIKGRHLARLLYIEDNTLYNIPKPKPRIPSDC